MTRYNDHSAQAVLSKIEEALAQGYTRQPMRVVAQSFGIFDWWPKYLTASHLKEMRQFLEEAIKLGYEGYVCFKVGDTGCSNGMWAHTEPETDRGCAPTGCPTLFRSFTPAYCYWNVTDQVGNWSWEGRYKDDEDRNQNHDNLKTVGELEAFIEAHRDKVYRK